MARDHLTSDMLNFYLFYSLISNSYKIKKPLRQVGGAYIHGTVKAWIQLICLRSSGDGISTFSSYGMVAKASKGHFPQPFLIRFFSYKKLNLHKCMIFFLTTNLLPILVKTIYNTRTCLPTHNLLQSFIRHSKTRKLKIWSPAIMTRLFLKIPFFDS